MQLDRPVRAEGNVENWLGDLLEVQQMSLNTVIKQAYNSLNAEDFDLITFIDQYIAQVIKFYYFFRSKNRFQFKSVIIILNKNALFIADFVSHCHFVSLCPVSDSIFKLNLQYPDQNLESSNVYNPTSFITVLLLTIA